MCMTKCINISHLKYIHPCYTIYERLQTVKEWRQATEYVNHPSNVPDMHQTFEPSVIYNSECKEPESGAVSLNDLKKDISNTSLPLEEGVKISTLNKDTLS